MKMRVCFMVVILSGCTSHPTQPQASAPSAAVVLTPPVLAPPQPVTSKAGNHLRMKQSKSDVKSQTYRFKVISTSIYQDGRVALTARAADDATASFTVTLHPQVARQLHHRYGVSPLVFFNDKHILVEGKASRTQIDFIDRDEAINKSYSQTRIQVKKMANIKVRQPVV